MCSHIALTRKIGRALARELDVDVPHDEGEPAVPWSVPRERIGPAQAHVLLRVDDGRRQLRIGALGLALEGRKGLLLNARSESVHRLPAFRDAFVRRRCLIPADAFFEWTGEKKARRAVRFERADGGLMLLGGLYEEALDEATGERRYAYAILTTSPNAVVGAVHDRMPVIVARQSVPAWLGGGGEQMDARALLRLLVPAPDDLLVADGAAHRLAEDAPVPGIPGVPNLPRALGGGARGERACATENAGSKARPKPSPAPGSTPSADPPRRPSRQLNLFD